ncbi:MAG: diguanylate cyclase [Polyangiaceae bacterium]
MASLFQDLPRLSSAPPISEREPRVLAVVPHTERQEFLEQALADQGFDLFLVSEADEVIRLSAEYEPDLVLLDVEQREMSGLEVCGDLKAQEGRGTVPVMLLSFSPADEALIAHGLLAGADDFIADAARLQELRARVRVQLRHKRHLDTLQRVRSERDLLKRDAHVDPLTGLSNRRALERGAQDRVDARERFGVLFIDADHFKAVNDRFGHQVGDRVLVAIADVLKAGLRPGDSVGRYGGEEFVVLVAGAGPEAARLVAERLRRSVEKLVPPAGVEGVTVSIGTAVFDPRDEGDTAQAAMRRADVALYASKAGGRNCVTMYSPAQETPRSSRQPQRSARVPGQISGGTR